MKAADFISTPDDLLSGAIRYGEYLGQVGWKVVIEPFDISYPRTPVFVATREHTTAIVEIQSSLELTIAGEWARYAKGAVRDTRVLVGLADEEITSVEAHILDGFRSIGVGLFLIGSGGPYEVVPAMDLALQMELPELPDKLRPILGAAYDLFNRGQWREGFEHACTRFEQEARKYLKMRVSKGGAQFIAKNGTFKTYSSAQIGKMTLGALAVAFSEMWSPNLVDSRLGQSLAQVNPDRITAAHYKGTARARENRLRKDVAHNMFIVVNALGFVKGIKR